MAHLGKRPTTKNLRLRSLDEFTGSMADWMNQFDEVLREHILLALYDRVWQRAWLEDLRFNERMRAPRLRTERIGAERMRKNIENVIKSLKTVGAGRSLEFLATDYIGNATELLERAVEDLRFLEDLLVALVHPDLRTETEKARRIKSTPVEHWNLFPGFGTAKIDQMFIGWMERYLSGLVTRKGSRLSSAAINRIIAATLDAASGEKYDEEHAKTTRRRLTK